MPRTSLHTAITKADLQLLLVELSRLRAAVEALGGKVDGATPLELVHPEPNQRKARRRKAPLTEAECMKVIEKSAERLRKQRSS